MASAALWSWLSAMEDGDVTTAWDLLHPDARESAYHGDAAEFAQDVREADWRSFDWLLGQPTPLRGGRYVIAVHTRGGTRYVPRFLLDRGLFRVSDLDGQLVARAGVRIEPSSGRALVIPAP